MADRSPAQQPWLVFIGLTVLVAALYVARAVLVPVGPGIFWSWLWGPWEC